jgi:hypothetical protein
MKKQLLLGAAVLLAVTGTVACSKEQKPDTGNGQSTNTTKEADDGKEKLR